MENPTTLLIGATAKVDRYAFLAAQLLNMKEYPFIPLGAREGEVFDQKIGLLKEKPQLQNIDTITIYMSAKNQEEYLDYFISLKPRRIIFNPGAENPKLAAMANEVGIQTEEACTLVLLRTDQY